MDYLETVLEGDLERGDVFVLERRVGGLVADAVEAEGVSGRGVHRVAQPDPQQVLHGLHQQQNS